MRIRPARWAVATLVGVAFCLSFSPSALAQTPVFKSRDASATPRLASPELIVLLKRGPSYPAPEEVIDAVNSRTSVPGGLGEGNPRSGKFAISSRARGPMKEFYDANPDLAAARLQRYIVLRYPNENALNGILTALAANPNVEHAEPNYALNLHAVPSDPFFPPNGDPEAHQWGPNLLNLPEAWDLMEGHATIGIIDTGIEPGHPEMEPFDDNAIPPQFIGGNFREYLSYDYRNNDCNADEQEGDTNNRAGHGMHVAGIASARADNGLGVAGTCWNCPFAMAQVWDPATSDDGDIRSAGDAINRFRNQGLQIISMSFGFSFGCDSTTFPSTSFFCDSIEAASEDDILLVASSGNSRTDIEYPANDERVIAAGGIEPGGVFWDEFPNCPAGYPGDVECGSNFGPEQELVAPAQSVLSTVYTGLHHIDPSAGVPCGDDTGNVGTGADGFGLCTGTSMSSPAIAGIAGLLRSTNPLLSQQQIREILKDTASQGGVHSDQLGYGYPNAGAAAEVVMGQAAGLQMTSRLTPFFSLYSSLGQAHLYTTSPQRAVAGIEDLQGATFSGVGPSVSGYSEYPGVVSQSPTAFVYLFSTPIGPPGTSLIPIYRMTKDANRLLLCANQPETATARAFAYAKSNFDLLSYRIDGYDLDGIEGYLLDPAQSQPAGTVVMHRVYNANRDDWAIVPFSELAGLSGYQATAPYDEIIGYAYPNVDTDGDGVIDGLESLVGTNPNDSDSDGDGFSDGDELLGLGGGALSDPLIPDPFFEDGFESGDTSQWSSTVG